jgi:hypothetical protein
LEVARTKEIIASHLPHYTFLGFVQPHSTQQKVRR